MKTVNLYRYEELPSEQAKEKARDWYRHHIQPDATDWSCITKLFEEELADLGYPTEDVSWSLSYCQGDGMAFYGKLIDHKLDTLISRVAKENKKMRHLWFKKIRKWFADCDFALIIERNHYGYRYSHYNTMSVWVDIKSYGLNRAQEKNLELFAEWLESIIRADVKQVSKSLERLGYDEIERLSSDEEVEEALNSFDYYFNEYGTTSIAS